MADPTDLDALPAEAWLCALSELEGMGPARLLHVLTDRTSRQAWEAVRRGRLSPPRTRADTVRDWTVHAARVDVAAVWDRYRRSGFGVGARESAATPVVLRDDPEPPAVLFHLGDPGVVGCARVGIVGTRRCTRYGAEFAHHLGRALSAAGVGVVSGLAAGIDGFAHRGALADGATAPIAVVGSGLDVVYPPENRDLWADVARHGVIFSEAPMGATPRRWRFPARNRLIAALADVVVVVESHESGGSMHTVAEAIARGRPVMAVPGSVRSAPSRGTNRLLAEGCAPVCDPDDVLLALGLEVGGPRDRPAAPDDAVEQAVLDACGWQPGTFEDVVAGSDLALDRLSVAVERLVARGFLARRGVFLERVAEPDPKPLIDPSLG